MSHALAPSSVQPLMFGPAEARLYGCYHAPTDGAVPAYAVLLCPPIGYESIRCHKALRILASRLSAAGCAVLRFDYLGCGDSAGEIEDASIPAWLASIRLAAMELRKLSQSAPLAVVGLRLGATLAAMSTSQGLIKPRQLVLWSPVVQGSTFVSRMREEHDRHVERVNREFGTAPSNANEELLGYRFPNELIAECEKLELRSLCAGATLPRTLLIDNEPQETLHSIARDLGGSTVDVVSTSESAAWDVEPHLAVLPHESIARIVQWLSGGER